jgi:cell division protein FtsQ
MRARWLLLGIIFLALSTIVVVVHSPLMAVERIDIRGAVETDVARVVAAEGVGVGALLLWVDTDDLEAAIADEPWVSDVRVQRVWPDTIEIEVVEREPVVWIEGVFGWMLVGRDGTVIDRSAEPGPGLMRAALAFPDAEPGDQPLDPAWSEVVEMALVLDDDIGSTLVLEMRGPEMWTFAFDHEVRLGTPIDLADKGRALRAMLGEDVPGGAIIDVSSPLRPAIVPIGAQLGVETSEEQG